MENLRNFHGSPTCPHEPLPFARACLRATERSVCWGEHGPVVRTPVSANPGVNFNTGFFFFLSKALSRIIFAILFRVFNHQIVGQEN